VARTDLEHATGQSRQQAATLDRGARVLGSAGEKNVAAGEEGMGAHLPRLDRPATGVNREAATEGGRTRRGAPGLLSAAQAPAKPPAIVRVSFRGSSIGRARGC